MRDATVAAISAKPKPPPTFEGSRMVVPIVCMNIDCVSP